MTPVGAQAKTKAEMVEAADRRVTVLLYTRHDRRTLA
jgi:hypothetical protein